MAGDTANAVLSTIAQKMVTQVVDAIGRQFGYLFFYKRNIKNLEGKVQKLKKSGDDADMVFKAENRNNKEISQSSAGWLNAVKKVTKAAEEVVEAKDEPKGWCLNVKIRYTLSRKSTKLATEIQELQDHAPVQAATNPALPAGMLAGSLSNDASKDFKTRIEIMDKVMEALKDDTINIIGICGLGGIGKTTILHEVRKRTIIQKLFLEVAMSTVSQDPNVFKIQSDIAGMLGLTSMKNEENIIARADLLHQRLTNGSNILVVLDDVWSEITLEEVGIPIKNDHAGCKVIIASRNASVCTRMGTQKTISVEVLSKDEAWCLFKKRVGDCVELEDIAKEVVDECGGLPIALITLASALSNKKRGTWEDTRRQLRQSGLTRIPGIEKKVYTSLMLSYNFLKEELPEAQPFLLICCQHPEDAVIKVEKLAKYCLALKLFKDIDKFVDARNKTYAVVDYLKSCFLLQTVDIDEEGTYETVKMHDVVRDVCFSIVSEMKEERDKVYMYMVKTTNEVYDFGTSEVDYPYLRLLIEAPLHGDLLHMSFLQQMENLRVFENIRGRENIAGRTFKLPPALEVLSSLRMLSLEGKPIGEEITSMIGSLSQLEILSFWRSSISSFPHQIAQLSNLKLLDLRCAEGGGGIPSGILLGLTKLEVLCLGYFKLCGAELGYYKDMKEGRTYARITELESLTNLTTLQMGLVDLNNLLELQHFRFEDLKRFYFSSTIKRFRRSRTRTLLRNTIKWRYYDDTNWLFGAKIQCIVRSTMDLQLENIQNRTNVSLEKFVSLRNLDLIKCREMEYIVPGGSLGELQKLVLTDMAKMRNLFLDPTNLICLGNLIRVDIEKCPRLESLFFPSTAKTLVQLQRLKIYDCMMLERIVSKGELGITTTNTGADSAEIKEEPLNDIIVQFPKLTKLELKRLPNLGGLYDLKLDDGTVMLPSLKDLRCEEMHHLRDIVGGRMLELSNLATFDSLQNLEDVVVIRCDSLESVLDFEGLHAIEKNDHVLNTLGGLKYMALHELPNLVHICRHIPEGIHAFRNLAKLTVTDCDNLGYLFSSSIAHALLNLNYLDIRFCKSMKEIIKTDEESDVKKIVFLSLSSVSIITMENLSSFCSGDQQSIDFPSLEKLSIYRCPEMETFCCGHLTADKLQGVRLPGYDQNVEEIVWKGDLNETIRDLKKQDLKEYDVRKEEGIGG